MSSHEAPWPAPAKLNRFLRITGRRADGYHCLQTVFQFLDRCDFLSFVIRSDASIERHYDLPGVAPTDDLSLRAASLLQQYCGVRTGVTITLDKRLPLGGGLGGGSSDAATVLVALNHYWRTGLTFAELAELGLTLGADVPVFVHGKAAWAEGVGELLTPLEPDEPWFVVLIPPCTVPTAKVFNDPGLTRDSQPRKIRALISEDDDNDCAAIVYQHYPQIAAAAVWLNRHSKARLTGTGACIFAAFAEYRQAQRVLAQKPSWCAGFVSRGCNKSLLHQRLQQAKITVVKRPFDQ